MHFYKTSISLLIPIIFINSNLFSQLCTPNPDLPQPTMICLNAPFICELQNYCSILPDDNEFPDSGVSGCPGFSALNNPAFFSFIATDNTVAITVVYGNCSQFLNPGIQMAIGSQCPAVTGQMSAIPGTCYQNCNSLEGNTTIGSNTFEIGKQYWFILDGCSGASCEFQIVHAIGADFPTLENDTVDSEDLTGTSVVCPGQTFSVSLEKSLNASTYIWNSPFIGDFNSTEPYANITIPDQTPAGSYTVCLLDANNPCGESLSKYGYTGDACFTFMVEDIPVTEMGPFNLCLGESYVIDGLFFTPGQTGIFTTSYILISTTGCDSLINLTLNVPEISDEIIWIDSMLVATQNDAEYQWYNCENAWVLIEGANAQSFTPENSGSYLVTVMIDGCFGYSECIEVLILSNESTFVNNPTFFYPNPASETLHFELNSNARIVLHNIQGSIVIDKEFSRGKQLLDVYNLKSGTYIAKVHLHDRVIVQKIILQK